MQTWAGVPIPALSKCILAEHAGDQGQGVPWPSPCSSGRMSTCSDTATVAKSNPAEQQGQTHASAVAKEEATANVSTVFLVVVVQFAACMTFTAVSAALLLMLLLHDWPTTLH